MGCSVVVGAFWGDEGKGKIISYLALKDKIDVCVRTGSVNAAHTIIHQDRKYALHMVPSAFVNEKSRLLIAAGANIHVPQLFKEIEETGVKNRIGIDRQASVIEKKHSQTDKISAHSKDIGTTGWGVGPAQEDRAKRVGKLARDMPELADYLTDVALETNAAIDNGKNVLLEGTQGLMLSLFFGTYPYVTSRDTSASAVCAEAGVGPTRVDSVMVVYKSFMTRVGAGELPGEISKDEAVKRGWFEIAAGTGRERRSAPFDFDLAKRTAMINGATEAAITKLDIAFPESKNSKSFDELSRNAKEFISKVEASISVPVTIIGTGPSVFDIIDRRC